MDSELNCMVDKPDDGWKGEAKRFAARIQELERERDAYRNELESIRKAVGQGVSTTPLIAFVNDLKARVQYLEQRQEGNVLLRTDEACDLVEKANTVSNLRAKVDAAMKALRLWGHHLNGCRWIITNGGCDCGYDEALQSLKEVEVIKGKPVKPENGRFTWLTEDGKAILPEGYEAPLEIRTTAEMIAAKRDDTEATPVVREWSNHIGPKRDDIEAADREHNDLVAYVHELEQRNAKHHEQADYWCIAWRKVCEEFEVIEKERNGLKEQLAAATHQLNCTPRERDAANQHAMQKTKVQALEEECKSLRAGSNAYQALAAGWMHNAQDLQNQLGDVRQKLEDTTDSELHFKVAYENAEKSRADMETHWRIAHDAWVRACKGEAKALEALREWVDYGHLHQRGCPEDDNCRCRIAELVNGALSMGS